MTLCSVDFAGWCSGGAEIVHRVDQLAARVVGARLHSTWE